MKFYSTAPSNKIVNFSHFVYLSEQHVCRPIDYMDKQPHITPEMRVVLVDWIIEVHYIYKLLPETLYLTIYIIDRYLSLDDETRWLQLIGMCAMLISCKYEEVWAPQVCNISLSFQFSKLVLGEFLIVKLNCGTVFAQVNNFMDIAFNKYTREEILGMEKMILNKLEWYLTVPTAYMFLVRFLKVAKADQEVLHIINLFIVLFRSYN